MNIINYATPTYESGSFGGLARFDYELRKVFPDMVSIQRSNVNWSLFDSKNTVVITDHTYVLDIPEPIKVIAVHHGMAAVHKERNAQWNGDFYVHAQSLMSRRNNTWFIGISKFTEYYAKKHHNVNDYNVILHSVDTIPSINPYAGRNVVGDWRSQSKGHDIIDNLRSEVNDFSFSQLTCDKYVKNIGYENKNIYLCLSVSEGNSYSMMDAIACGLPILSTNVGLFYGDYDKRLGEVISWEDRSNFSLIKEKLEHIYENYNSYDPIGWLNETIPFDKWKSEWRNLVEVIANV